MKIYHIVFFAFLLFCTILVSCNSSDENKNTSDTDTSVNQSYSFIGAYRDEYEDNGSLNCSSGFCSDTETGGDSLIYFDANQQFFRCQYAYTSSTSSYYYDGYSGNGSSYTSNAYCYIGSYSVQENSSSYAVTLSATSQYTSSYNYGYYDSSDSDVESVDVVETITIDKDADKISYFNSELIHAELQFDEYVKQDDDELKEVVERWGGYLNKLSYYYDYKNNVLVAEKWEATTDNISDLIYIDENEESVLFLRNDGTYFSCYLNDDEYYGVSGSWVIEEPAVDECDVPNASIINFQSTQLTYDILSEHIEHYLNEYDKDVLSYSACVSYHYGGVSFDGTFTYYIYDGDYEEEVMYLDDLNNYDYDASSQMITELENSDMSECLDLLHETFAKTKEESSGSDKDNDGYTVDDGDCDDNDADINPGIVELCDGVDNNCNGIIDAGQSMDTYYIDNDGDGYGAEEVNLCIWEYD